MNSLVTLLNDTSVMSSSCLEIRFSSRSNGPSKFVSETRNPALSRTDSTGSGTGLSSSESTATAGTSSGDGATGDQLPRQWQVCLGGCVLRRELGDGHPRHGGVRELH